MKPLLVVKDLVVHFPIRRGVFRRKVGAVRAVDGVTFTIEPGETVALVGESGCGKTTVGRALMKLVERTSGGVYYEGAEVLEQSEVALRAYRRKVQMVFQDPMTSLDPKMTTEELILEGPEALGLGDSKSRAELARTLIEQVQLAPEHLTRYPHEFSGGQRQRIGIARALAVSPELIICDEAVSALDVSIQAQILNLLADLQARLGVAYLFITHDLSVVRHLAKRVLVMYLGQIVEEAETSELFAHPRHPYTSGLLAAVPSRDPESAQLIAKIEGDVPSSSNPPSGCRFHTRCERSTDRCRTEMPELVTLGASRVRCHFPLE